MALEFEEQGSVVMGKEPVLVDGRAVGYVTSAAYGHSVGAPIAYAWLPAELAAPGQRVTVRYFDEDLLATVSREPMFDPDMARLRS